MRNYITCKVILALLLCISVAACDGTGTGAQSIIGKPSLLASQIDKILCNSGSPACGVGQAFYRGSLSSGIDDAYALAFFKHESSYGKYGIARRTLAIGNIRCNGWAGRCIEGFRAYTTWSEGVDDWYSLIRWYVDALDKETVQQILYTYSPPGDDNDTASYIRDVCSSVNEWRTLP